MSRRFKGDLIGAVFFPVDIPDRRHEYTIGFTMFVNAEDSRREVS